MRSKRIVSNEIIQRIDIANTVQGGVTEPQLKLSQHPEFRQIQLRIPGVSEKDMHVKINNNQLIVYFERRIVSLGSNISIPYIVYNKQIPYFIDEKNIHAQYHDGELIVQLPFNELTNGYQREVPIDD
jgi:HSP20 family molecular chaperone IbpA